MVTLPDRNFDRKRDLVALLKAQVALLREAHPEGVGRHLNAVTFSAYDDLIAGGASARWPTGMLSGLRQGIRDFQTMLVQAYGPRRRSELLSRLRALAGSAVDELEAQDAKRLATILKRGRIRSEDEYHLARAALDALEADPSARKPSIGRLRQLVDSASVH